MARNYFDLLPDEMVYEIFSKIPKTDMNKVAEVCQRFERITYDERMWKRASVTYPPLRELKFEDMVTGPCRIKELNFEKCLISPPDKSDSTTVAVHRLNLSSLLNSSATPKALEAVIEKYQAEKLILDSVFLPNNEILNSIARQKNLQVLSLQLTLGMLHSSGFLTIVRNCRQLKELNLSWAGLKQIDMKFFCRNSPGSLQKLRMNGLRRICNEDLQALTENSPDIEELGLPASCVKFPALAKFTSLNTLFLCGLEDRKILINFSRLYLTNLPKLEKVHLLNTSMGRVSPEGLGTLKNLLKPRNIEVTVEETAARLRIGPSRTSCNEPCCFDLSRNL